MTRPASSPFEQTCDGRCPAHHGRYRFAHNDPGCHCRVTCASQPTTLLVGHKALFLNHHGDLWAVPMLAPDRFDWRRAAPVTANTYPATGAVEQLLHAAQTELRQPLS